MLEMFPLSQNYVLLCGHKTIPNFLTKRVIQISLDQVSGLSIFYLYALYIYIIYIIGRLIRVCTYTICLCQDNLVFNKCGSMIMHDTMSKGEKLFVCFIYLFIYFALYGMILSFERLMGFGFFVMRMILLNKDIIGIITTFYVSI